jgi:gamma-glutamyl-gamma-aminobutyrate hydrolase PuuD
MFHKRGFEIVTDIDACDIIAFSGGEDIDPALYGEYAVPRAQVYFNQYRDQIELQGYHRAKERGVFKFGICRGGQLLNVMNGGKLWQDVNNHNGRHPMLDVETGRTLTTSSVHHQMFRLGPDCVKLAVATEATSKIAANSTWHWDGHTDDREDVEVCWYPKDRALCIQGHPEYGGYDEFTDYCFEQLEKVYANVG